MRVLIALGLAMLVGFGMRTLGQDRHVVNPEGTAEFTERKGNHSARLILTSRKFTPSRHRIVKLNGCVVIDGRAPIGTDCGLPKVEIASMRLFFDGSEIHIPRRLYSDYYSPPLFKEYQRQDAMKNYLALKFSDDGISLFVFLAGGDGAGVYDVIWLFRKDGHHARFTNSGGDCGFLNFACRPN